MSDLDGRTAGRGAGSGLTESAETASAVACGSTGESSLGRVASAGGYGSAGDGSLGRVASAGGYGSAGDGSLGRVASAGGYGSAGDGSPGWVASAAGYGSAGDGSPRGAASAAAQDPVGDGIPHRREPAPADRPGMPSGGDPWDARSGEWLTADLAGRSTGHASGTPADPTRDTPTSNGPRAAAEAKADVGSGRADVGSGRKPAPSPRRGAGDPVKALLHRHRELCERAVDPLEIAAALEAHGVTDRTAARFRHRDVFSLAEELYARVPRTAEPRPDTESLPVPRIRAGWVLLTLLPGALGAVTVTGLRLAHGHPRLLVALGGLLAIALATRAALRHGPLAGPAGPRAWRTALGTRACTLWLLGYALAGDGLLHAVLTGGPDAPPTGAPDGPWPTATAPVVALLAACAPAAWSAHLLAAGARRRLAGSRDLGDFTAAAKPLLSGAFVLFLGALAALLALCDTVLHQPAAPPQALTLGALLLLARLLTVHRHRHAPALALGAAAATEAAALALPLVGRLPGCAFLATPVETLTGAWGEAAVPVLACGTAALALLWHAGGALTRASAHAPTGAPE